MKILIGLLFFAGLDVDDMPQLFTSKYINIFAQYVLNKIITCDDQDPPWMTAFLKSAIKRNYRLYNKYVKRGQKPNHWEYMRKVRNEASSKITKAKDGYLSNLSEKLSDPTNFILFYLIFSKRKLQKCMSHITVKWVLRAK